MSMRLLGRRSTRLTLAATLGLALAATLAATTPSAQGRGGAPGQQKKAEQEKKGKTPAAPEANDHGRGRGQDQSWRPGGGRGGVGPSGPVGPLGLTVGRNVNMVSGTKWPTGDPYLQRQNEPSVAASTRNPLHLLAGANDYRTVDVPFVDDADETGDAWLGVFKSLDGGQRWRSTLIPGYPQDTSAEGVASPLHGYAAAADPVVRAGTSGLLYYSGIVFDRASTAPGGPPLPQKSAIFVARYIDNNNREAGDPIRYLGASIVAQDSGLTNTFLDKPWLAVDIPRGHAPRCRIETPGANGPIVQRLDAGFAYMAFSAITRNATGGVERSDIMFTRSTDCGVSWSRPIRISDLADPINQGATIAIDPRNGNVHVAWRRISPTGIEDRDAFMAVSSTSFGHKFLPPGVARRFPRGRKKGHDLDRYFEHKRAKGPDPETVADDLNEFDQSTSGIDAFLAFRTNAYPTMTVDDTGRIYVAWSERGFAAADPTIDGDARVVIATSRDGRTWTDPQPVADAAQRGHQLMPSLTFAGGKLLLVFYDLREDVSQVFTQFVDDRTAIDLARKRHTMDIRASVARPADQPAFEPSVPVSDYLFGFAAADPIGSAKRQLQFNPPNLPMFRQGTVPFMGDYIDVTAAPVFVTDSRGQWRYNTDGTPVFHAVWTDNRDVRQPVDGPDPDTNPWNDYTAPTPRTGASLFDPSKTLPSCVAGNTGSRNQNIYTARITDGLLVGSPGNAKPLDPALQRAFVVFAQNTTDLTKSFRLTILNQPPGGHASFDQFTEGVTVIDVTAPPRSTATRSVYVTSTDPNARVDVDVAEIESAGVPDTLEGGLRASIVLNPDIENPDIENPDIENPDIENPDIENAEVYNPDIENPDIENPDIENPDIENPDIENPDIENPDIENPDIENPDIENIVVANPDIENPDIENPDIENPDIENPDIENPDIENPDIENGTIADISWQISNVGNTTSAFNVNLFLAQQSLKLCPPGSDGTVSNCINVQLILRKTYTTPTTTDCTIKVQTHNVLVANIPNPRFVTPDSGGLPPQNDPSQDNATLWLAPGEVGQITLRVIDPDKSDNVTVINENGDEVSIDPTFVPTDEGGSGGLVTPVLQSQSVGSDEAAGGATTPPIVTPNQSSIFFVQQPTTSVAGAPITPAVRVQVRDKTGAVLPGAPVTLALGTQPPGAVLSGTVVQVTDATGQATFADLSLNIGGSYTLVASNPVGGSAASSVFRIGCEFPTCGPPTPYGTPGGAGAYGIALADFDVDGDPDVVATSNTTNDVFLFTGAGDGTFSAGTAIAVAAGAVHSPALVAAGDVNNDGKPDFVVANYDIGEGVTVVYGNGLGGFTSAVNTPLADLYTFDIALADVDGNGWLDIVTGGYNSLNPAVSEKLYVLLNDGTGAFLSGNVHAYAAAGEMSRIVVGDFNGDMFPDVAGTDARSGGAASYAMSIMLNDGFGAFSLASTPAVGDAARVRAVGDLNGDGHVDLGLSEVPTGFPTARLAVFYGDGTGAFGPAVEVVPASSSVAYATSGDFNGDGHADLAVGNVTTGGISFLLGNGAGAFTPSTDIVIGSHANQFVPADLNNDGATDLVVVPLGSEDLLVLLNTCGDGVSAALSVSASDAQDPVDEGDDIVITFTVANAGPDDATGVVLTSRLPTISGTGATVQLPVVSAVGSQGSCAWLGTSLRCDLGAIGSGDSADVTVTLTSPAGGSIATAATALAEQSDPDTTDNTASETTTVSDVGQTLVVTNTNNGGAGSLRQAMILANMDAGSDVVAFDIPGPGPHTIVPNSPLPAIVRPVVIDGETQPVAQGWEIIVDGTNAGAGAVGFEMNADSSTVHFLTVQNFSGGGGYAFLVRGTGNRVLSSRIRDGRFGVFLLYAQDAWVHDNNISGNAADGVLVVGGADNVISRNTIRTSAGNGITMYDGSTDTVVDQNRIFGNLGWGVDLQHSGALALVTGTQIVNNTIGLDSGSASPNAGGGVRITSAPGTAVGAVGAGNVISGNSGHGVLIQGSSAGTALKANKIGTDLSGTVARPNGPIGSDVAAVFVSDSVSGVTIGGDRAAGEGNVVSGNNAAGIKIWGHGNFVYGNTIGTTADGTAALPNHIAGVHVEVGPGNTIGGPGTLGNLISGNAGSGVLLSGMGAYAGATGTVIENNVIGLNLAETGTIENAGAGVDIREGAAGTVLGNTIGGNVGAGVAVWQGAAGNTITANSIDGNGGLGIDLENDGVTANDAGDGDGGSNGRQNFPVLTKAVRNLIANQTEIAFTFAGAASSSLTLEFFSSSACDPSGFGEGGQPLGTFPIGTDLGGLATGTFVLPGTLAAGSVVTATATDADGNTSEFSACMLVGTRDQWSGQVYEFVPVPSDAFVAEAACQAGGGHLASIHSLAENSFVGSLIDPAGAGNITAYIGGFEAAGFVSGSGGLYTWTDGSAWSYSNWRSGEPNGSGAPSAAGIQLWPDNAVNAANPLEGGSDTRGWNDVPAAALLSGYVCKF